MTYPMEQHVASTGEKRAFHSPIHDGEMRGFCSTTKANSTLRLNEVRFAGSVIPNASSLLLSLDIPRSKRVQSRPSVSFWAFRPQRAKSALLPKLLSRKIMAAFVKLLEQDYGRSYTAHRVRVAVHYTGLLGRARVAQAVWLTNRLVCPGRVGGHARWYCLALHPGLLYVREKGRGTLCPRSTSLTMSSFLSSAHCLAASLTSASTAYRNAYPLSFQAHIAHSVKRHSARGIIFLC